MTTIINGQNNIPYGALKDRLPQNINEKLPQNVQNLSAQDVKDTFEQNEVVSTVSGTEMTPRTLAMTGGFWLGFIALCEGLNKKFSNPDYSKTWLGKIGAFGDNVSNKFTKGKGTGKVASALSNAKNWVLNKFPFLNTFTKPTNTLAKSSGNGILGYEVNDVLGMVRKNVESGAVDYRLFGASSKDELVKNLTEWSNDPRKYIDKIDDLVSTLKSDRLKNVAFTEGKSGFFGKTLGKIFGRKATGAEMGNKMIGSCGDLFTKNKGATTRFGQKLTKNFTKVVEGVTNGYAGGKVMIVIQAMIFAQAIDKALKAPKGEKFKTFANEVGNDLGLFLAMPLYVQGNHLLGSLKYIGMGKDKASQKAAVEAYRNAVENINKKLASSAGNPLKYTRSQYMKDVADAKKLLKGNSKWWQKPFKAIGKFVSTGLEDIKPYTADLSKGAAKFKTSKFKWTHGRFGGALRFAIGMFVIAPVVGKAVSKIVSGIFGKTTEMKEEEAKEKAEKLAKKQAKLNANKTPENTLQMTEEEFLTKLAEHPELVNKINTDPEFAQALLENPQLLVELLNTPETPQGATPQNNQQQNLAQQIIAENPNMSPSLRNRLLNSEVATTPITNSQAIGTMDDPNRSYIPSSAPFRPKNSEPMRTYVPSSAPANLNGELSQEEKDNVQRALQKADWAEAEALKLLG